MNDLNRITELAELLVKQQKEVKEKEEKLKAAKAEMYKLEREDLPTLMSEAGLQEVTLSDGSKVTVKEEIDAKITDKTRTGALHWLLENNFGGLIKTEIMMRFPRGDHETAMKVRDELAADYDDVQLKEDVHPMTLKSFIKEQLSQGHSVPMDLFNVFPYSKAVVKLKEK